jgi:hypothetical protein
VTATVGYGGDRPESGVQPAVRGAQGSEPGGPVGAVDALEDAADVQPVAVRGQRLHLAVGTAAEPAVHGTVGQAERRQVARRASVHGGEAATQEEPPAGRGERLAGSLDGVPQRSDGTRGRVDAGETGAGLAAEGGELAGHVHRRARRGQREHRSVGGRRPGQQPAGPRVHRGESLAGHRLAVDDGMREVATQVHGGADVHARVDQTVEADRTVRPGRDQRDGVGRDGRRTRHGEGTGEQQSEGGTSEQHDRDDRAGGGPPDADRPR